MVYYVIRQLSFDGCLKPGSEVSCAVPTKEPDPPGLVTHLLGIGYRKVSEHVASESGVAMPVPPFVVAHERQKSLQR